MGWSNSRTLRAVSASLVTLFAGATAHSGALPDPVQRALAAHQLAESGFSVYVREISAAEPLLEFNAGVPRNPASTIKVLTTLAALDTLGPAYEWMTRAYLVGELSDGRLEGDLVLEGGGDPFLVVERWWSFVQGVRRRGLRVIGGDLVIDNSYFSIESEDPSAFDGQPFRTYNVVPDALLVNFRSVNFQFQPDPINGHVLIGPFPRPANLEIDNRITLTAGACRGYQRGIAFDVPRGESTTDTVILSGRFPRSCGEYSLTRAVLTAPEYAYGTFRTLWEESGGTLAGSTRIGRLPEEAELYYEMRSLPLAEIIRRINKFSSNVMTRHLVLTMGAERYGAPGTVGKGLRAIDGWLASQGLEFPDLQLENGAGLSRDTRIAASSMGELLLHAYGTQYSPEFMASLPLAAMDGTLRDRFITGGMAGRLRLKTGRLDHVSAIAGYVDARSGRTYVVVALHNDTDVHRGLGEDVQDALVRWVFAQ